MRDHRVASALLVLSATGCIESWPDPAPTEVQTDVNAAIVLTVTNRAPDPLGTSEGRIALLVEGREFESYDFASWPFADRGIFDPEGESILTTRVRLRGIDRRVAVIVDPDEAVVERDEWQNVRTRSLTPAPQNGPDLAIADLTAPDFRLLVEVVNRGSLPSSSGSATLRVDLDGRRLTSGLVSVPALDPGERIALTRRVRIPTVGQVRATLDFLVANDLDVTNNTREEVLPDPGMTAYNLALFIAQNEIVWWDHDTPEPFATWSAPRQAELRAAIEGILRGDPHDLPDRPAVLDKGLRISYDDGWQIFISSVAQSIWVQFPICLGVPE